MATKRKWWLVKVGAGACLLSWVAVGVGFAVKVDFATWFILLTIAALTTEGLFWLIAAVFGMTMFEARKSIWRAVQELPKRLGAPR